ncbi:MAG: hypothetical protein U5J63_14200 [Fodinibius sp.]|nr:hypothetical protein [Fodinibius sp.]
MMKKLIFPFLLCLIVISTSFAQTQRNDYKKIDYIKVNQEHLEQFMQLANNELKSNFASLIDQGQIKSWALYRVQFPGGQKSNYDFISITTGSSLDTLGNSFSNIATLEYLPGSGGTNGNRQFESISSLVKSEIWKVENLVSDGSDDGPSRYMTMDYMNVTPGKSPDYLMLEDEIAKPIHEERIEQKRMAGWEVYSLILPGGINYGYNFATGNYFDSLSHIEFGFNAEIIKQTMGTNSNVPELSNTIYDTRDLVQVELWELVNHVN